MMVGENFAGMGAAYEPLDLFHYSAAGVRDFSGTTAGYFSANSGTTNLGNFNTNSGGDFGDWAGSVGNNSFLAYSNSGVVNPVTASDLTEMNLLGWDPSTTSSSPPVVTVHLTQDTGVSSTDNITSNPALNGTADANAVVTLTEGSTVIGTTTANASGNWSYTPTGLAQGAQTVVASETNAAGVTGSSSLTFTLESTPPTVTVGLTQDTGSSSSDHITSNPALNGTADANAVVTLTEGSTVIGTTTANASGNWSYTPTGLAQGAQTVVASETNAAGVTGSSSLTFTLESTPPTVTVGLTQDTGSSSSDHITSNPALNGTADANAVVTLTEGSTVIGTTTANASGNWSLTPTGLAQGAQTVVASETNAAGVTGSSSLTFTLESTPPTVTVGLTQDTGSSSSDHITSNPALSGTADANAVVTLTEGSTVIGTTTANASGNWSYTPTGLAQGAQTVVASETNAAGVTGSSSLTFTLESTPPTVTVGLTQDTGSSSSDHITSNPALSGTADANAVVTLTEGSTVIGTTTANASGNWSYTPTGLAQGAQTVVASETNAAGVTGSSSLTFTLESTPPTVTVGLTQDTGSSSSDHITSNPALNGTADANAVVTLTEGSTVIGTTTANASGNWSLTPTGLAQGAQTVVASETNAAGVTGSSSLTFTLESTPPTVTVGLTQDTGSSSSDHITSNPALNGTADANAVVTLTEGSTVIGTTTANASGNWSYTPTGLAQGAQTVVASETNAAGVTGSSSLTFTLESTPPTVTVGLTQDTGSSSSDHITSNPALNGTADANAVVTLTEGSTVIGTTTANASGNWSYTPTGLAQGAQTVVASETNAAGVTGSSSLTFTLESTPPTVTVGLTQDTGSSSSDHITSNPALNGTADANAVVTLTEGSTVIGTTTANASGNWSLTPTGLAQGAQTVVASETNAAGVTGSSSLTFTLESTPPTVTVGLTQDTGSSSSDHITSNPALNGTADANAVVTLTEGSTVIGTTTANASGNWSLTPTGLAQGAQTVVASETNAAGVTGSSSLTFTLESTPPTVTVGLTQDTGSSSSDHITSNPALSGTADANAVVTLTEGSTVIGTTTANASGNWSYTPTGLAQGAQTVVASETNAAGVTGSSSLTFTLESTPPTVTVGLTQDTGSSSSDHITSNPALNGTADANAVVTLTEGSTVIGTTTANASGNWSFTPTGLAQGAQTVVASETNAAGVTGSSSLTFTLESTPPTVTVGLTQDTGSSSSDHITSNPALSGTADANAVVTLTEGSTVIGTTTANASGNWSYTPTGLAQGAQTVVASETNAAGVTGSSSLTFTLESTPPTVTVGLTQDTGSSSSDHITSNPALNGTADANAVVTLTEGSTVIGTTTANASGNWSFTPTGLAQGAQTVVASETNAAGVTGSSSLTFTLESTPPTVTVGLTQDTGSSSSDHITSNPALNGTADANAVVTLTEGSTVIGTTTANASGNWSFTPTGLAQGAQTVVASETNAAGVTGSSSLTFTLESTPPTVTVGLTQDTGSSSSDHITSNPALNGTADANAVVTLTEGSTVIGTTTANASGNWSYTPTGLAQGAQTVVASETNAAGVTGSSSLTFTLESTPPTVTVGLTQDTGSSSSDHITSNPALSGTADANAVVTLTEGSTVIGTTTANASGNWSYTPTGLAQGAQTVVASETNAAGVTGSSSLTFTLESTPPTVTVGLTQDTGSSSSDHITSNPALNGTADANAVVTLTEGSTVIGTTTANASGNWSYTPTGLAQGAQTVVVSETNAAGVTGSSSLTFTLESTPPTAPVIISDSANSSGQVTLNGTAPADSVVSVYDGNTLAGTTSSDASGSWQFTTATETAGAHLFTATVTDLAGNVSAASNAADPVIVGPTVTVALSQDTGSSSTDNITSNPALSGTADANAVVTLTEGSTVIGTTTANASGNWSYTPTSLAQGAQTVVASETNAAGVTGSSSLTFTLESTPPTVTAHLTDDTDGTNNVTANPALTGTADANAVVTLTEGSTVIGTTTANASGNWSYTPTGLAQGAQTVVVSETNAAGVTGSSSLTFTLESTPPTVTVGLTQDTGGTNNITSNPALNGTADANAVVTLTEASTVIGTTTADASGNWSYTPPGLAQGAQTVVASETNAAGLTGSSSLTFTLDTTPPTVSAESVSGAGISSGVGALHAGSTAALTFTMSEAVTVSGGTPTLALNDGGTATYDAAHSTPTSLVFDYTVAAGQYTNALAVTGINSHGASVTDAAGNLANLAGLDTTFSTLLVDATTPAAHSYRAHSTISYGYGYGGGAGSLSVSHAQAATSGVLAGDTDANPADVLSVSAVNGSATNVSHAVTDTYGSLTLNSDGSFVFTDNTTAVKAAGGVGEDFFNYTVSNGHGGTVNETMTVLVTGTSEIYLNASSGSTITAGSGNYVLDGSNGNMHLNAGKSGTQWLVGGPGDTLTGGNSTDRFMFAPNFGNETINNFNTSHDVIDLPASMVENFTALQADMHASGANTVITLDAQDAITITNMTIAHLTANNFHFII